MFIFLKTRGIQNLHCWQLIKNYNKTLLFVSNCVFEKLESRHFDMPLLKSNSFHIWGYSWGHCMRKVFEHNTSTVDQKVCLVFHIFRFQLSDEQNCCRRILTQILSALKWYKLDKKNWMLKKKWKKESLRKGRQVHLPAHFWLLHSANSNLSPLHGRPPFTACICLVLFLHFAPPPHIFEHELHAPNSFHLQSIVFSDCSKSGVTRVDIRRVRYQVMGTKLNT